MFLLKYVTITTVTTAIVTNVTHTTVTITIATFHTDTTVTITTVSTITITTVTTVTITTVTSTTVTQGLGMSLFHKGMQQTNRQTDGPTNNYTLTVFVKLRGLVILTNHFVLNQGPQKYLSDPV